MDAVETMLSVGGPILLSLLLVMGFIKKFLVIGRPNELLVFSGRQHVDQKSGERIGWRIIRGGRSFQLPILERVDRMDMTIMAIDIKIRGAYAKGNIPINVDAVANAKITGDEALIHHAIERFLGKSREEMRQVVRETLEGTLRGVLAQLTPEEVNHDRQKLAETLKAEVADDLGRMGLMVDTFKIQHVADDVSYLDSISRVRIAEVLRDAEVAESDMQREAEQAIAGAAARGQVALENAEASVVEKENELERVKYELEAQTRAEEERTTAAGREARARAEQTLQEVRQRLERLRLQAETVIPAQKDLEARELRAAGDAAIHSETGRAQSEALKSLYGAWSIAGDKAKEIFLIQQIDRILQDVAEVTNGLEIGRVNLIDGGDGKTISRFVGAYPLIVVEMLERIRDTIGVDVVDILTSGSAATATQKEA